MSQPLPDHDVGHPPDTIRHVDDLNLTPEGIFTKLLGQSTQQLIEEAARGRRYAIEVQDNRIRGIGDASVAKLGP